MKLILLFLLIPLFLLASVTEKDSLALVALHNATNGANWKTKWDLNSGVKNWHGVTIRNSRVIEINLVNNGLVGVLPSELATIDSLEKLSVGNNSLSGTIPAAIFSYDKLHTLYLNNNALTGALPQEIGNQTSLVHLNVWQNQLSGPLPDALYNLTNLKKLVLSNNQFTGTISSKIAQLDSLQYLYLKETNMEGSIPSEIGQLSNLLYLDISKNSFNTIPKELAKCSLLNYLVLSYNPITELPSELGQLANLTTFNLAGLSLGNTIPEWVFNLSKLTGLDLSRNNFSGTLPISIKLLSKLSKLNLSYNNFEGSIEYLTGLNYIRTLHISWNNFSGTLSNSIYKLKGLYYLYMDNNAFEGALPDSFYTLTNLRVFNLHNNKFEGAISDKINNFNKMNYVTLSNNKFNALPKIEITMYSFNLKGNQITFKDIIPNLSGGSKRFYYNPQDTLGKRISETKEVGEFIALNAIATGHKNNSYKWFKDGQPILGATDSVLKLLNLTGNDNGAYHCEITNSQVQNFTLRTHKYTLTVNDPNSIKLDNEITPLSYSLKQNYPNPFNPSTTISYSLAQAGNVKVSLYNMQGRLVETIYNGAKKQGAHTLTVNAAHLSSGSYFYRIETNGFTDVKRMMLIK